MPELTVHSYDLSFQLTDKRLLRCLKLLLGGHFHYLFGFVIMNKSCDSGPELEAPGQARSREQLTWQGSLSRTVSKERWNLQAAPADLKVKGDSFQQSQYSLLDRAVISFLPSKSFLPFALLAFQEC